jgi:hypothetical protein
VIFLRCGGVCRMRMMRMRMRTLSEDDLRDVYDGRLESEVASSNDGRLYGHWAMGTQWTPHPRKG